ncbi:hypothetical protein SUGI_0842170 [Cryptomeria japonica]|uniref:NDR1/HIN1-like protein 6 n=1 Tax=Cryptomeria japonica TaxID=3369 RepID=UPI002414741D|nr:NDR1/HIN1-like protein 6 [Cryptomeria japonica]GLJ40740.1 hypothetical protein SUGI_0842170 [Cryptomeria japonica]
MARYERLYTSHKDNLKPGVYVIELPKDQVLRLPGPRTRKIEDASLPIRCKKHSSCLPWILRFLLFLIVLVVILVAILFLVFQPRIPKYSVEDIKVHEFNLSRELVVMDVIIRAKNPNKRIGIDYKNSNRLWVSHYETVMCRGSLPGFHQGHMNTSTLEARLTANGLHFPKELSSSIKDQQNDGDVHLNVGMDFPVTIKMGILKSMKFDFKVRCDLSVMRLLSNQTAGIQRGSCRLRI